MGVSRPIVPLSLWCASLALAACGPSALDPSPPLAPANAEIHPVPEVGLSCAERAERVESHLTYAWAEARTGCTTDADCTTVAPRTECGRACPRPVARGDVEGFLEAIEDADDRWCDDFVERCGALADPTCEPLTPACREARCVRAGAPAEEPAGASAPPPAPPSHTPG